MTIEEKIMIAAIDCDEGEVERLLKLLYPSERWVLLCACSLIQEVADEVAAHEKGKK